MSSIISERSQPGGEREGGGAARAEFVAQGERHADDGRLGEVVEEGVAVVLAVVGVGSVGHLDDQTAGPAQQQGQGVVAGDRVRVDREPEQPEAVFEVVLPHRGVPPEEVLAAPDVVDEDVEAVLLVADAVDERADLGRVQVVGGYGDAVAAGRGDEVDGVLDGLGAVVVGAAGAGAASGDVDGGARRPQFHGDPAARSPGGSGDQRDLAPQRL
ncbi:hypothetical protein RKD19_000833 [Streptomyces canus]